MKILIEFAHCTIYIGAERLWCRSYAYQISSYL